MTATMTDTTFASALAARLRELDRSQTWLGVEVGALLGTKPVSQSAVSSWTAGQFTPAPDVVFAIEEVVGVRPGQLSRHLGYLPLTARSVPPGAEEAIRADVSLPEAARRALLACLRELRRL